MTTRTCQQYIPRDVFEQMSDTEARQTAREVLEAQARAEGEIIEGELTAGNRVPVALTGDAEKPFTFLPDNASELDGWSVEWSAESVPAPPTDLPSPGVRDGDSYVVDLPPGAEGEVRAEHGLGVPVIVKAYAADGEPVGYLFMAELTDDVTMVTLAPGSGAARLVVTPVERDTTAPVLAPEPASVEPTPTPAPAPAPATEHVGLDPVVAQHLEPPASG